MKFVVNFRDSDNFVAIKYCDSSEECLSTTVSCGSFVRSGRVVMMSQQ